MQRLRASVLILFLSFSLILPAMVHAADGTVTVQPGDTLTSIAARNGTTVDALVAANGLSSANVIYAGQNLVLPGGGAAPAAPASAGRSSGGGSYTVQPGEYLSGIAERLGVSQDALMQANGITNPNLLFAGQNLTVPGGNTAAPPAKPAEQPAAPPPAAPAAPTGGGGTYTVRAGDSMADIAAKYGVSLSALLAANSISNPEVIYSGQVLNLPNGSSAPAAQPAPPKQGDRPQTMPEPTIAPPNGAKPAPPPPDIPANQPVVPPKEAPPPATPAASSPAQAEKGETVKYTVKSGDRLYSIAAAYGTTVDAIVARNDIKDVNMIHTGQVLTIVQGDKTSKPVQAMNEVPAAAANKAVPPKQSVAGKWIDVNISTQRLTAYEGDNAVFSTAVSTGTSKHPTVIGTFKIQTKYVADDMTGGYGAEYYYLPAVPYTMYFYGGYAIHGTYWHHNFGTPMSHGCVNLPTDAAKWMFEWASIGTPVVTHW